MKVSCVFNVYVDGEYENCEITPYSTPPDLPDVMRTQDGATATGVSGKE